MLYVFFSWICKGTATFESHVSSLVIKLLINLKTYMC